MVTLGIALGYLAIISISDAKNRKLGVGIILVGSGISMGISAYSLYVGKVSCLELLLGAIPGILMLCISGATKAAGLGDGIILLQVNGILFLERTTAAFCISLIGIGIFSVFVIVFCSRKRNLKLPYMPFLWLGCLTAGLLCG